MTLDAGVATSFIRRSADYDGRGLEPLLEELGGKGRALAAVASRLPVPPWFALMPSAFYASAGPQLREALSSDSSSIAQLNELRPSPEVSRQLRQAQAALCPHGFVAVRSSASEEDSARSSFAGQLESYLFVTPEQVEDRVVDVWRSAFSDRVRAYRRGRNATGAIAAPAVIVQCMIDADVSGVAFSADPVSGRRDVAVVAALYGLGSALVSGDCDADTYHVERDGAITGRRIANKSLAHRAKPGSAEGVAAQLVDASISGQPAVNDTQIRQVAELARRSEREFGVAQDIEWAIQGGELYLLQSRPITTLASPGDPTGALKIWDNSNIAESYGGVTTPLTFSFARHAYDGAYRQFCRLMHISEATVTAHDDTFRNMLGLIQGRVYYNLLNWYRVLALLPGYRLNRRFMEQMMGVKESLPDGVLEADREASFFERLRDGWSVAGVALAFTGHYLTLRRRCDAFFVWLRETLGTQRPDYSAASPEELVATYRRLESRLITRWDAPLINDLFAMIFFGTLRRLCERWCGDTQSTLQNGLVSGQGGMISAEPAKLVIEMARVAAKQPSVVTSLCADSLPQALAAVESSTRLSSLYREYLDKFGDRTTDELKLESPTLHDDPLMLLRSVGGLAERFAVNESFGVGAAGETQRAAAERRVSASLRRNPMRRVIFSWVLRNARQRIIARENLRFERTRLFGRVRSIFTALGRSFQRAGVLPDGDLIFYLEVEEALGYVEGTATSADLAALAALRKAQFERYRAMPAPPDRFETRGMVGHAAIAQAPQSDTAEKDSRTGLGCCPGTVRGQVRVVTDPRRAGLRAGEILVAERTDPGWVMLFPSAAGLLVERGSLLSHSAIVAREMRIPAVVALSGVMSWLKDGDWVELDGSTGRVVKIAANGTASSSDA